MLQLSPTLEGNQQLMLTPVLGHLQWSMLASIISDVGNFRADADKVGSSSFLSFLDLVSDACKMHL
jgi:hypothetical protein